jgi:hypothetical protein
MASLLRITALTAWCSGIPAARLQAFVVYLSLSRRQVTTASIYEYILSCLPFIIFWDMSLCNVRPKYQNTCHHHLHTSLTAVHGTVTHTATVTKSLRQVNNYHHIRYHHSEVRHKTWLRFRHILWLCLSYVFWLLFRYILCHYLRHILWIIMLYLLWLSLRSILRLPLWYILWLWGTNRDSVYGT